MARPIMGVYGVVGKLARHFECSTSTVYNALKGHDSSELKKKIRETALKEFGCKYM